MKDQRGKNVYPLIEITELAKDSFNIPLYIKMMESRIRALQFSVFNSRQWAREGPSMVRANNQQYAYIPCNQGRIDFLLWHLLVGS